MARPDSQDSDTLDQAIAWHIRVTAPDAKESTWAEFSAWLEADPANRKAYDHVEDMDADLEDAREAPDAARFQPHNMPRRRPSPPVWVASAALLAATVILAFVFWPGGAAAPIEYTTRVGETKVVELSDGTRIEMNTRTRLRTEVGGQNRGVALDYGEALFRVAKDPRRPFVVMVGDRRVSVLGTVFNVLRNDGVITVFLAEGRIAMSPRDNGAESRQTVLSPGDQLTYVEATGGTTIEKVDARQAFSWREGYLVYRNAPLSKVVSDLNRYFPVPIVVEGKAGALRFSGVLVIDNENAVLARVATFLPVIVEHGNGRITLRAAGAGP